MGWFSRSKPKVYTGKTLSPEEAKGFLGPWGWAAQFGKGQYAEVNSSQVIALAQATRDALWGSGITKWSTTATCTLYASRMASIGQERFFNESFQDFISKGVLGLAVGEVWFHPDSSPLGGSDHAINVCLTEKGALYIDPQLPDVLRPMSQTELNQVRSIRFL